MEVPSRQEMFNRAWNGLKSQGWKQSVEGVYCAYLTDDGRRCAWGWVDPEGTSKATGNSPVFSLHTRGIGLAAQLFDADLTFAANLQAAHDVVTKSADLEPSMRMFAAREGLTIPEDTDVGSV